MKLKDLTEKDIEELADSKENLKKGKECYKEGKVKEIEIDKKVVLASLQDNPPCDVEITFYDSKTNVYCDCASKEPVCKHAIAVLYKLLNEKKTLANPKKRSKYFPFDQLSFEKIAKNSNKENILKAFEIFNGQNIKLKMQKKEIINFETNDKYFTELKAIKSLWEQYDFIYNCSCEKTDKKDYCRHVFASLLFLLHKIDKDAIPKNYEEKLKEEVNKQKYKDFMSSLKSLKPKEEEKRRNYELIFSIKNANNNIHFEVKKAKILRSGEVGKSSQVGLNFVKTNYEFFSEEEKRIFNFIYNDLEEEDYAQDHGYYAGLTKKAVKTNFENKRDLEFLEFLREVCKKNPEKFSDCEFLDKKALLELSFNKTEDSSYTFEMFTQINEKNFHLNQDHLELIGNDFLWIYIQTENQKNILAELEAEHPLAIKELAKSCGMRLSKEEFSKFLEEHYIQISNFGNINLSEDYRITELDKIVPKPRIFLRDYANSFCMDLKFSYQDKEVSNNNDYDIVVKDEHNKFLKIKRNKQEEEKIVKELLESAEIYHDVFLPKANPLVWLCETAAELISRGYSIYGQEKLVNYKIFKKQPKLDLKVSSGVDWFDIKTDISFGKEKISFEKIAKALEKSERFVKLSDGSFGVIPKKWISKLSGVIGFLEKGEGKEELKASKMQLQIIESLLEVSNKKEVDKKYKELHQKFQSFKGIKEVDLPKGFKGNLREYQKAGYYWLNFLKEFSFGGCLADEMGLGKSAQTLALLLSEKEKNESQHKSLIVVPTSLIFNWVNEIKKFTPDLKVYIHHGSKRLKVKKNFEEKNANIVLTSYGTLRNDIEFFKKNNFHYIILDESQQIKNPFSQIAKSVYELKGKHRLVLTGTPIENNYLELWSQFSFLNPGILGRMDYFKNNFMTTMNKQKSEEKSLALKNMIHPFLLMRKKESVAKDLPEKQITTLYCEMEKEQKEFYEKEKEKLKEEIKGDIQEKGFAKSKLKILQGLTKLRQVCNHPSLIDKNFAHESGKLKTLMAQITEVIESGHKVLIFSSFVKMLSIFREEFKKEGINFSYLDGQTKNREEVVKSFQENKDIKAFLISLKAGGVGLNLTAADYVFIVDPWWNPAVEMQAIDRAHRIGQENKVFVYKTITKDTIEEKILKLQESKRAMVEKVIAGEEGIFKQLEKKDVLELFG